MSAQPELVKDGRILADAVDAVGADDAVRGLADAGAEPARLAACALAAGARRAAAARDALLPLLARDDVAGRAAAWALAQLDAEPQVLAAIDAGRIDARDNGYWSLAVRAAAGRAGAGLAAAVTTRVAAELERARSGASGLGDRACRVLAVLGAPNADEAIQQVLDQDRFADRFELQRLRKAVQDGRRDGDSIAELAAPWRTLFADHLYVPPAAAPAAPVAPAAGKPPVAPIAKGPARPPAAPPAPDEVDAVLDDEPPAEGDEAPLDGAPAPTPIDWKAFLASPEAAALTVQARSLAGQLGPVLEQLAVRAINAPLADLSGQELAALLLQVLPQALPQQHVQAALSPHALNGYQALAKFLARTGAATHGGELASGIKLVRQQLQAQIRQAGILNGPDYSDPDEAPAPIAR